MHLALDGIGRDLIRLVHVEVAAVGLSVRLSTRTLAKASTAAAGVSLGVSVGMRRRAVADDVDAAAAEAVAVNGVTAWQMLHGMAKVRSGGTIVVLGANGGVGSVLVQLALHAGIAVIGTASPHHHPSLRKLGRSAGDC